MGMRCARGRTSGACRTRSRSATAKRSAAPRTYCGTSRARRTPLSRPGLCGAHSFLKHQRPFPGHSIAAERALKSRLLATRSLGSPIRGMIRAITSDMLFVLLSCVSMLDSSSHFDLYSLTSRRKQGLKFAKLGARRRRLHAVVTVAASRPGRRAGRAYIREPLATRERDAVDAGEP